MKWNHDWTAPFVAVSQPNSSLNIMSARVADGFACDTRANNLPPGKNHPNTSEGRRQLPRYPLMSLRNQVRSACIQAKNFTTSHVQASQHHCITFTNKIHLQNTIWDWKLGNEARIANIPTAGACKSQKLTPRFQWWNVALSVKVASAGCYTPITAKKYCDDRLQKLGCTTLLHPKVECCIVRHGCFRRLLHSHHCEEVLCDDRLQKLGCTTLLHPKVECCIVGTCCLRKLPHSHHCEEILCD